MLKIKIWQVDFENESAVQVAFLSLDRLERHGLKFDANNYRCVWSGWIDGKDLEDVYYTFNMAHPADFRGHSLSVSDVVEVLAGAGVAPGFYFCDSWGWKKVENWERKD